jgi:hypothetical protein
MTAPVPIAELAAFDEQTIARLVDGTHRHARRRADEMAAAAGVYELNARRVYPRLGARMSTSSTGRPGTASPA